MAARIWFAVDSNFPQSADWLRLARRDRGGREVGMSLSSVSLNCSHVAECLLHPEPHKPLPFTERD